MVDKKNRKKYWLGVIGVIILLFGLWQYFSNNYREEEKELRTQIRKTVKEMFPEKVAEFSENFGLFIFN